MDKKTYSLQRRQPGVFIVRDAKEKPLGTITGAPGSWYAEGPSGQRSGSIASRHDAAMALVKGR